MNAHEHFSPEHRAWRDSEAQGREHSAQARRARAQARALAREVRYHSDSPAYDALLRTVLELTDHRGRGLITQREWHDGIRAANRRHSLAYAPSVHTLSDGSTTLESPPLFDHDEECITRCPFTPDEPCHIGHGCDKCSVDDES